MTQHALISDVHLREESAKTVFEEVLPGLLKLCQERKIFHVMALGDWFHLRYRVPVWLLNLQREWLQRFWREAAVHWHFLPGNHDQIDVQGRNALEIFAECENVKVHNDPGWDDHGLWVPYRLELSAIQEALALPRPKDRPLAPNVCWMHYGVRGAMQNSRREDTDGVDPHLFAKFDRVLCGHYHQQQDLGPGGKISYVGSPYQTRSDEAGDPKGVAVLHDYRTLERLDMAWGARYVHSRIDALDDVVALCERGKGAVHRITVRAGVRLDQVAAKLEAAGISRYTLTPEPEPFEARLKVADSESLEAYARAFMEANIAPEEHDAYWATFLSITEGKHDASSL